MKSQWFKKLRLIARIQSQVKRIRDNIYAMAGDEVDSPYYEENKRKLIEKIIALLDTCQEFLCQGNHPPNLAEYENISAEEANLSLSAILVLFRRALVKLQHTPSKVQRTAIEILYSYFTELQGLYDLIFVRQYKKPPSFIPHLGASSYENYQQRYFPIPRDVADDVLIQEYRSITYNDLMNTSVAHHLHVVLLELLPHLIFTTFKDLLQKSPRCRRVLDPQSIHSVEQLREVLRQCPLNEATKLAVALHRHTMRIFDLLFTRFALQWGHPFFEMLVLATWCQTVNDHIVPDSYKPSWAAEHPDVEQEVTDKNGNVGKVKMSSAFFMQPRVKFRLERFLIFKNRTMTVGDIVRSTEFGNWMRQYSPDESLQFFNIAFGDMGGLGIRTMPEHEIMENPETLWLYGALMNFVPGGLTSPGSIAMRQTNYGLCKTEQLLREILYYDPRFKYSSGFFTDLKVLLGSISVLNKGRVGKALEQTESFDGKRRGMF